MNFKMIEVNNPNWINMLRPLRVKKHATPCRCFAPPLVFVLFLLMGCGKEEIALDLTPPETPQFVARSADTVLVEQGIDAVSEGEFIRIFWQSVYDEELGGYRIYRQREDSVDFLPPILIKDLTVQDVGGQPIPTYLDMADSVLAPNSSTGLTTGFYYWVSAYDQSGNESILSQAAYYKLIPKAQPHAPVPQINSLLLTWGYAGSPSIQIDFFVLRLYSMTDNGWTPFWMAKYQLFSQLQVVYPLALSPGTYLYQVDVVGASSLPSGSEATVEFTVN